LAVVVELADHFVVVGEILVAAARVATEMESGTIVALLPDGGWKYLSAGTYSTNLDEMEEALEGGVNWW
jgi:hypothetical protein